MNFFPFHGAQELQPFYFDFSIFRYRIFIWLLLIRLCRHKNICWADPSLEQIHIRIYIIHSARPESGNGSNSSRSQLKIYSVYNGHIAVSANEMTWWQRLQQFFIGHTFSGSSVGAWLGFSNIFIFIFPFFSHYKRAVCFILVCLFLARRHFSTMENLYMHKYDNISIFHEAILCLCARICVGICFWLCMPYRNLCMTTGTLEVLLSGENVFSSNETTRFKWSAVKRFVKWGKKCRSNCVYIHVFFSYRARYSSLFIFLERDFF